MTTTANDVDLSTLSLRQLKAIQIASSGRIVVRTPGTWIVPSQSDPKGRYTVTLKEIHGALQWRCACVDFDETSAPCKHVMAVNIVRYQETPDGSKIQVKKPSYPQQWTQYNRAQVNEKDLFVVLLNDLCSGIEEPPQENGRPRIPLSDLVFAAATKVYVGFSGRRASSDIREAMRKGHITRAAHYNSVFRAVGNPTLTPLLYALIKQSAAPLREVEVDMAADSSGITTSNYVRWFDHKHGKQKSEHAWLKVHLMCGVKTNVITSVEVSHGNTADSPEFIGLLDRTIDAGFKVREVSADKAYSSHANVARVVEVGAKPYIPFRSGTGEGAGTPKLWRDLHVQYQYDRERFLTHYHKRSNVESTFSALKRKFGSSVRSKKPAAQVNEILLKVLCFNICTVIASMHELGVEPRFWGTAA